MVAIDGQDDPRATREFEADVVILHHSTTVAPGYQPVIHCGVVRQAAAILSMSGTESGVEALRTGQTATVRFRFMVSCGSVFFRAWHVFCLYAVVTNNSNIVLCMRAESTSAGQICLPSKMLNVSGGSRSPYCVGLCCILQSCSRGTFLASNEHFMLNRVVVASLIRSLYCGRPCVPLLTYTQPLYRF